MKLTLFFDISNNVDNNTNDDDNNSDNGINETLPLRPFCKKGVIQFIFTQCSLFRLSLLLIGN